MDCLVCCIKHSLKENVHTDIQQHRQRNHDNQNGFDRYFAGIANRMSQLAALRDRQIFVHQLLRKTLKLLHIFELSLQLELAGETVLTERLEVDIDERIDVITELIAEIHDIDEELLKLLGLTQKVLLIVPKKILSSDYRSVVHHRVPSTLNLARFSHMIENKSSFMRR